MNTTADTVSKVFLGVVEKLAFMFGDPCEMDDVYAEQGGWVRATITYDGEQKGAISLSVPVGLCAEISANILGMDPEDIGDDILARDSLKEMLNVVCGHVVPALQSEDRDFELGLPCLDEFSADEVRLLVQEPGTTCYNLDCSPVILSLTVHDGDD